MPHDTIIFERCQIWVLTTTSHISFFKSALQEAGLLDKSTRIASGLQTVKNNFSELDILAYSRGSAALPTNLIVKTSCNLGDEQRKLADCLGSKPSDFSVRPWSLITKLVKPSSELLQQPKSKATSKLFSVVDKWLRSIPSDVRTQLLGTSQGCYMNASWRYNIYGPLLVLSAGTFQRDPWKNLLLGEFSEQREELWKDICDDFGLTHIGLNAPIPLQLEGKAGIENVLRSPQGFVPLYGDFGCVNEEPIVSGFERTFWAHVQQNGIEQVFAPVHTMFSRGNVTEKQRILDFQDLKPSDERSTSVVDLYAGIGYFAFSYAKAGASLVLCWEINKWSVEGFRRGAARNKWRAEVVDDKNSPKDGEHHHRIPKRDLIMFSESNENALFRIREMRTYIPPVTHVNCGYLPTSEAVWADAVFILDPELGGFVHAHENVAVDNISQRSNELEELFTSLANRELDANAKRKAAKCTNVERVKSYAPGVMHCVFDMHIASHL